MNYFLHYEFLNHISDVKILDVLQFSLLSYTLFFITI